MSSSDQPYRKCGVLGATGSVGQRFILLLEDHPWLELVALGASDATAARKLKYKDAVTWRHAKPIPTKVGDIQVVSCDPANFAACDLVFSGLDSGPAEALEVKFTEAGINVFSNAKTHRQDPDVPLVVPTVNIDHLDLIRVQQQKHEISAQNGGTDSGKKKGFIVCNSNCAVVGLVVPFAALQEAFGPIDAAAVTTLQSLSGAGYPGPSAIDMTGNIIPFIPGEESKLMPEARKILGALGPDAAAVQAHGIRLAATCTRVAVPNGHTASVALRFARQPPPSPEECERALESYVSAAQKLGLPSAPRAAVAVRREANRPQPMLDVDEGGGYTVTVGRVRADASGVFDLMFVSLSHNTVIGAAGGSILNAEAAIAMKHL